MNSFKKAGVLAVGTAALVAAGAGAASASSEAEAVTVKSSGALSGNIGQAPFHTPAEGCGNTANTGAALNPAFGNACVIAEIDEEGYVHDGYQHEGQHRHEGGPRSILDRVAG